MAEPKPLASLSAGLLARKGAASPAMRRQQPGQHAGRPPASLATMPLDDCGWNDMGYDVDPTPGHARHALDLRPLLTPATAHHASHAEPAPADMDTSAPVPEIVRQQAELSRVLADADLMMTPEPFAEPAVEVSSPPPPVPARSARKAAFTLRLDEDRHLRLRLASAVMHRSSQRILVDLLDQYLASAAVVSAIAGSTGATIADSAAAQSLPAQVSGTDQ